MFTQSTTSILTWYFRHGNILTFAVMWASSEITYQKKGYLFCPVIGDQENNLSNIDTRASSGKSWRTYTEKDSGNTLWTCGTWQMYSGWCLDISSTRYLTYQVSTASQRGMT